MADFIPDDVNEPKNKPQDTFCNGDGECLIQSSLAEYVKNEDIICNFNCAPVNCPNYLICNEKMPLRFLMCHNGMCINCDVMFGTWRGGKGVLEIADNIECPVCLEFKKCVSQPMCDHFICIDCFKRCFFPNYGEYQPPFPYSEEIYEEYEDSPDDPKWKNDDAIKKWLIDCDAYEDYLEAKSEQESNLRICPICRK